MSKSSPREIRESLIISKAELARKANISPNTLTRIEQGRACRVETKRKIILDLGLKNSGKNKVVCEDIELSIKDKQNRRSGMDRRNFLYDIHIPDDRSGKERRSGIDS
ncbi:helix-turn-helix transcriptional regulator [bacterium]|nr:helix-turn-helix transcriptional regulator [bacterium]